MVPQIASQKESMARKLIKYELFCHPIPMRQQQMLGALSRAVCITQTQYFLIFRPCEDLILKLVLFKAPEKTYGIF